MTWGERRRAVAPDGAAISWWSYGDGPPLLLVAGQAVDHRSWDRALTGLGAGRRVLVYDHRGIGDSERGDGSRYSTRRLAEDAVSVLDDAGVDRADVLGHSMGGRIAQWLAIDHAERVGRLVLAATSAGDRHTPARDPEADEILRSGETGRLAQLFFPGGPNPQSLVDLLAVGGRSLDRSRHFRASRSHDALADLGAITAPTLVVHGELDRLTPASQARLVARAIPGARLAILRGAGHGVVLDGGLGAELAARWLADPQA